MMIRSLASGFDLKGGRSASHMGAATANMRILVLSGAFVVKFTPGVPAAERFTGQ